MDPTQIPLRDLHLPEAIGWWPLAPGWWFLIALAAAGILWFAYRSIRRWRQNAARRVALRELRRIQAEYQSGVDEVSLAIELSELLRRTMLAYAPRDEVAGLTGDGWLHWLDAGLEERPFSEGAGKSVDTLPYRKPGVTEDDVDLAGLIEAIRARLRTPLSAEVR